MVKILPAIIAKTQYELDDKLTKIKDVCEFIDYIHLDIMNNTFIQNSSLDFDFNFNLSVKSEAHLMINNPIDWTEKNHNKVDTIIAHFESLNRNTDTANNNIIDTINFVKDKNKKIGLALSPETSINEVKDYLDDIDQLLILAVNPGFYGSKFLYETVDKINQLRKIKPDLNIEVDGGITPNTIGLVKDANLFVSGSYLFNNSNIKNNNLNIKEAIDEFKLII